ncbi:MAG: hypothetical protein WC508_02225 [Patescibacteria group bacterium]
MAVNDNKKTDDFFSALAQEQQIENPFATEEILFRDENGVLKILKGGQVLDYTQNGEQKDQTAAPLQPEPLPVLPKPEVVPSPPLSQPVLPPIPVVEPIPAPAPVTPSEPLGQPLNLDEEIEMVIKKSGIHFTDQQLAKRFTSIITSRLKHIRDQVQTKEALLSSPTAGGMGFTSVQADRIMLAINQVLDQLSNKLRQGVSQEPFSDLQQEVQKLLAQQPLVSSPPKIVFSAPAKPVEPAKVTPIKPVAVEKPQPVAAPKPPALPQMPAANTFTKPKIEDVRFEPKLTGPIEEIHSMTLIDFRRLGSTPQQAIEKIIEKIDLLEEESFTKKTQAIKAWKENEVYRLYLALGDQSMEERKPIAEIIEEKQKANQPTLTSQEVEAIIELNQKLRY